MLARRAQATGERFTFHSSRAVLKTVDRESLVEMMGESDRCASELAHARVDAYVYACLIAVMVAASMPTRTPRPGSPPRRPSTAARRPY